MKAEMLTNGLVWRETGRAGLACRESDSGLFSWRRLKGMRRAVDERRIACGWTRGAVARIQQITSLDPRRLTGKLEGLQLAATQQRRICVGLLRAYHHN
jgi:hypothetical protein